MTPEKQCSHMHTGAPTHVSTCGYIRTYIYTRLSELVRNFILHCIALGENTGVEADLRMENEGLSEGHLDSSR